MHQRLKQLAILLSQHNIQSYYVGGYVRDMLMGIESDDIDICLVGVTDPRKVEDILMAHSESVTPLVGQKFPVWIATIDGKKIDFAMARKETLVGSTRRDFHFDIADITIEQDLFRRDFTINAIAKNIITDEYVDPFDGILHIKKQKLHPTSEAFKEDSLRVYRAARFLARFSNFWGSPELYQTCMDMKPDDISDERVGLELMKMLKTAQKPSKFFGFLWHVGWLPYHFKELDDCIGVPQNPDHHPEGDVYQHTMYSMDEAVDWFTRVCMLCHDLGKATHTTVGLMNWMDISEAEKEYTRKHLNTCMAIKSIGHETAGMPLTRSMLTRIHFTDHKTIRQIETMVELHMIRTGVSEKVVRRTLRKLMEKGLRYEQLVEVCRCDLSGRPPLVKFTPDIGQHRAQQLLIEDAMTSIVTGEKLIAAGYEPGKLLGHLVKKGLEWQDRGTLSEENWLKMIKQYKPDKKEVT